MELAGVLIAVLLLIFLIYKRLSLIPATLICVGNVSNCDPFLWRRQCICYCIYRISHFSCNISQGRSSGKIYSSLHYEQLLYICPFAASWRSPVKQYYSCTVFGHNAGCSCRDRSALLCCGYGIYIRIFFLGI